jgi:circadian clock protein KaiC
MEETIGLQVNKAGIERVQTGIEGLDKLISGGYPQGSFTVVTGPPGCGKSILAIQFLTEGVKHQEKCLFLSVEQSRKDIVEQAWQFGWDLEAMEHQGLLKIIALNSAELFDIQKVNEIKRLLQQDHYNRLVIDSITSFVYSPISATSLVDGADRGLQPHTFAEICRANISSLIYIVKQMGITCIGIAQKVEGLPGDTVDNVSEFKADALLCLDFIEIGEDINRTIKVKKMRKTEINGLTHTFEFTPTGIVLKRKEV